MLLTHAWVRVQINFFAVMLCNACYNRENVDTRRHVLW
jgi:hypothetical protein